MNITFGAFSHATGALAYLLLTILFARGYWRRLSDRALFSSCLLTAIWLSIIASQEALDIPGFFVRLIAEILKNTVWIGMLFILLGVPANVFTNKRFPQRWLVIVITSILVLMILLGLSRGFAGYTLISGKTLLVGQILVALVGLVLLEQVWRNAMGYKRKNTRYLCLAIGTFFLYDFFLYSDALLFNRISDPFWESRGIVYVLCGPLVALTLINTRKQPIDVQISRKFIFHTSAIVFAGLYLLIMAGGGYYINAVGGEWSEAVLVIFFFASCLFLLLIGGSSKLRARLMVFISHHFFDYKYDYREEWLKATGLLTARDSTTSLENNIIKVMAQLVKSQSGAIWTRNEDNNFAATAFLNMPEIKFDKIDANSELTEFMSRSDWVVDLKEYQADPTRYQLIEIPDCIWSAKKPWLLVPFFVGEEMVAFVLISEPLTKLELNWENYDLLRVVARQSASYLTLLNTQAKLSESKQFEAVNRISAFMVHDLKTIIAQLSLLVKNAEKHKSNPVFVDDMINTTEHALKKMNHLLQQIRNPVTKDNITQFNLADCVKEVIQQESTREPSPTLVGHQRPISIQADKEKLKSVLLHVINNAQDATDKGGEVTVSVKTSTGWAVVFVQDTGAGMTDTFIKEELFRPFSSTKGLTGMGIGVYQSREYIRKLGGSLDVTSEVGVGTCFTIKIPLNSNAIADQRTV